MAEHETPLVQQPIYTELDSCFDNPSKRPIVMISDIGDQERIIGSHGGLDWIEA
jgi:hypothetical protein